ncbi:MAG: FadR/GntR family transcriptional regulator [Chloroflexi bacterium]|nr:FadR/GntR family transcriptional regulator [Chloroflexota bacterium]
MARPIRSRLHDEVVVAYTGRIVREELAPGDFLPPEPIMGDEFGISRAVVREALRILAARGLVGVHHGIGTIVREPHDWNVLDPGVTEAFHESPQFPALVDEMLEARRAVEVQAAALAAQHAVPEHKRRIDEALAAIPTAIGDDPMLFNQRDIELHAAILEATENRFLYRALSPLFPLLRTVIRLSTQGSESDPVAYAAQSHAEIVAAIIREDAGAAAEAMSRHLSRTESDIRRAMDRLLAESEGGARIRAGRRPNAIKSMDQSLVLEGGAHREA